MTMPGGLLQMPDAYAAQAGGNLAQAPGMGLLNSMPAPQAAQLPAQAPKQSLWSRVQSILMPQQGMAGLLDDDGVTQARHQGLLASGLSMLANSHGVNGGNAPSVGQAIAGGVQAGQQAFQGSADQQVQGGMQAQQLAEYRRVLQNRAAIAQKYAPSPNETPTASANRLRSMAAEFARVGDTEMLKTIGGANGELFKDPNLEMMMNTKEPVQVDLGGKKVFLNPYTWQPMGSAAKVPEPVNPDVQAMRDATAQARTDAAKDRNTNQSFQREAKLTDDFTNEIKPITDASRALMTIHSLTPAAQAGDGMAQNNLLMALIKLQHPTTTVRRGEMLSQEDARSLPQSLVAGWQHITKGGKLAPEQIQSILSQAHDLEQQWRSQYAPIRAQFESRAKRYGIDPSVLDDPFEALGPSAGAGAPPASKPGDKIKGLLQGLQ